MERRKGIISWLITLIQSTNLFQQHGIFGSDEICTAFSCKFQLFIQGRWTRAAQGVHGRPWRRTVNGFEIQQKLELKIDQF